MTLKPFKETVLERLRQDPNFAAAYEDELRGMIARIAELEEAWRIIDEADKSEKGSGGEMWYAEVMSEAVRRARDVLIKGKEDA